jgi:hypothetical protein
MADLARDYSASHRLAWTGCPDVVTVEQVASGSAERLIADGWTGAGRPDVWSPAATTWVALLRQHLGSSGRGSFVPPDPLPSVAKSPLVVAVPQDLAKAASWDVHPPTWQDLVQFAQDPKGWGKYGHPEWGPFRIGMTDPGQSTSGLHSLIAIFYAAAGNKTTLTPGDVTNTKNQDFVRSVEGTVSHYAPTAGSFLNNLSATAAAGQSYTYISALPAEEQEVFSYNEGTYSTARPQLPPGVPLEAVYPSDGTLFADHPYVVLHASWVTAAKKAIADSFLQWLRNPDQQSRIEASGFRDFNGIAYGSLQSEVGIRSDQPRTLLNEPAPSVTTAIQGSWKTLRKPAFITILLDLNAASQRADVIRAVASLSSEDEVAISVVSPGPAPAAGQPIRVGSAGNTLTALIGAAPINHGPSPLYRDISVAVQEVTPDPRRINALVVIAATRDDGSGGRLTDLERTILNGNQKASNDGQQPVRIYMVALQGSDQNALFGIETASGGVPFPSNNAADAIRTALASF